MWNIPTEVIDSGSDERAIHSILDNIIDPDGFLDRVKYLYEHRDEKSHEEIVLKDNRVFDRYSAPMTGNDNTYYGRVWYFRDITDRKRAEEKLRESEGKYRDLFNNAEVGIFRSRLDGSEVIEVNRKFLDIVGMTLEETLGKPSVNLWVDPKEREEMVKRLVADGNVLGYEYHMLNKRHGDVRNCLVSLRLYRDQGILEGSIIDITERKQAEESLRESESE